jgi:hypothetical protein
MTFLGKPFNRNQIIAWTLLLTLTVLQLVRVIVFVNEYGGLEHDGGWLLGISRSLAERGTYTTMVSTIVDPATGADINVDRKFDIQDQEGRIWFFTGNGIGPGSIAVNAIFLKLFGFGFWPLHGGPLFFLTLFLLLASAILLGVRGLAAMLLFNLYLWLYPHLIIFLGYEAMGEMPTMVYILLAYMVFACATPKTSPGADKTKHLGLWFYLSGLAAGLVINTKLIALLSLGGIVVIWLTLLWNRRVKIKETLALIGGALTIPVLWELVHLIVLTRLTNFHMYTQHLQERLRFIADDGSGIGAQDYGGTGFFWDKVLIISEISHPHQGIALLTLALVGIGGLGLIWLYRQQPNRQNWIILLWVGWLGNMAWFVGIGKTGWVRHAWFGLILAVLILCVIFGEALFQIKLKTSWRNIGVVVLVMGTLLPGFVVQKNIVTFFISDNLIEQWRQKQIAAKYSVVPWMLTPRAEQQRVVDFIQNLPPDAHVFYPENHKSAEIAVQTGRIFYPIARREFMSKTEDDVIIMGITLISPWKDPGVRHSLIERAGVECPNFVYQSEYYILCRQW